MLIDFNDIYIYISIIISAVIWYYYHHKYIKHKPQLLYHDDDKRMKRILQHCPSLFQSYNPPLWTAMPFSEWIQIMVSEIRNALIAYHIKYIKRQILYMSDGGTVRVDIADTSDYPNITETSPILILLHTIVGSSETTRSFILYGLKRGWRVIVFNRRGHDMNLSSPTFHPFGDVNDTEEMLKYVHKAFPLTNFVGMIGLSAGSALIVRFIGNESKKRKHPLVDAAVSISFAYHIDSITHLDCDSPIVVKFNLLRKLKTRFVQKNRKILHDGHGSEILEKCLNAKTITEFFKIALPYFGNKDWKEFYDMNNPLNYTKDNTNIPCLILNSLDDPVSLKLNIDKYAHNLTESPNFIIAITKYGSHVSFRDGRIGLFSSWMERVSIDFLEAVMQEKY